MQKRVFVTGGLGFIGRKVAIELDKKKFKVIAVDKKVPQKHISLPKTIQVVRADLRNREQVEAILEEDSIVVHLAANIGSLTYMENHQAEILAENTAIDAALYPAMVKKGVSTIIYSSSSMVFQHAKNYPYKEDDLPYVPPPTNVYGLSKLIGEYFCKSFHAQYGLDYVILRYHNIYGPGEEAKGKSFGDIHPIPAFIQKILAGQYPIELLGNPNATRPFTYIDDAVSATVQLIEEASKKNPKVINEDFNIGPNTATKIVDVAEIIWTLMGDKREFAYIQIPVSAITAERREMDDTKIKNAISWEAKTSLKDGISNVLNAIKTQNNS